MPITANVKLNRIVDSVHLVITYFKKKKDIDILSVDINGYLFYKYRGMLFVRRGITHTFFKKDLHLLKNYLEYIINYLANENAVAWTRTVFVMEILLDLVREKKQRFGIVIEVNNEGIKDYGQVRIKPFISEKNEKKTAKENEEKPTNGNMPSDILEIDDIIEHEDMNKIAPIDVYSVLTPREVEELMNMLRKIGINCTITNEEE
ncbi:MAG: hypothetical protein ACP6IP_08065 [Candidatus Njordarchaeia archaeon]